MHLETFFYITIQTPESKIPNKIYKVKWHFVGRMSFLIFLLTQTRIFVYFFIFIGYGVCVLLEYTDPIANENKKIYKKKINKNL